MVHYKSLVYQEMEDNSSTASYPDEVIPELLACEQICTMLHSSMPCSWTRGPCPGQRSVSACLRGSCGPSSYSRADSGESYRGCDSSHPSSSQQIPVGKDSSIHSRDSSIHSRLNRPMDSSGSLCQHGGVD